MHSFLFVCFEYKTNFRVHKNGSSMSWWQGSWWSSWSWWSWWQGSGPLQSPNWTFPGHCAQRGLGDRCLKKWTQSHTKLDLDGLHKIEHNFAHKYRNTTEHNCCVQETGERERMQIPQFNSAQDRERLEKAWRKFLRQFRLIWPTFASCPGPWLLYFTLLLIWEIVSDNLKSKWEREETMGWPTFRILLFLYHITLS